MSDDQPNVPTQSQSLGTEPSLLERVQKLEATVIELVGAIAALRAVVQELQDAI